MTLEACILELLRVRLCIFVRDLLAFVGSCGVRRLAPTICLSWGASESFIIWFVVAYHTAASEYHDSNRFQMHMQVWR